jgi:hypothetical protein
MSLTPGSPEWQARFERMLAQEDAQPEGWWFLSFSDGAFLGACFVQARGMTRAIQRAKDLGIDPGGQVMALQVPPPEPDVRVNALLQRGDSGIAPLSIGEMRDAGMLMEDAK